MSFTTIVADTLIAQTYTVQLLRQGKVVLTTSGTPERDGDNIIVRALFNSSKDLAADTILVEAGGRAVREKALSGGLAVPANTPVSYSLDVITQIFS
jgi:hypothetical protein